MLKIHLTRNDIKKYNTSPLGLVVPEFIGQYWITDDNKVYFAKGLTSLDWIEASASGGVSEDEFNNLVNEISGVKSSFYNSLVDTISKL